MAPALILLRTTPDTLLERIAELSGNRRSFRLAVVGAACVHAGLASWLASVKPAPPPLAPRVVTELVAVDLPAPVTAAPPEEPPLPPVPASKAQPTTTPATKAAIAPAPAAPAGQVLARTEDSEQPLDFTDSIVTGNAQSFAGGVTTTSGISSRPGRGSGQADESPRARGNAPGNEPGIDRSRAPSVLGALAWNCPFPSQADVEGVNSALVTIRVEVDATGRPQRVLVLSDPGHGFGEAARRCALGKRWTPGSDRWGRPHSAGVNLSVRFVR
jgi:protein TonB